MHIYLTSDDSNHLAQLAASLNQDLQAAGLAEHFTWRSEDAEPVRGEPISTSYDHPGDGQRRGRFDGGRQQGRFSHPLGRGAGDLDQAQPGGSDGTGQGPENRLFWALWYFKG